MRKHKFAKIGFFDCFSVDCVGRNGGLAIFWKRSVEIHISDFSQNHTDVLMYKNNMPSWRLSCYYGFPERSRRKDAWEFIRDLARKDSIPWCILGDFNDMLYVTDKKGLHKHPTTLLNGFRNATDSGLVELELVGGNYTWERSRGKEDWVRERLDRTFASEEWWRMFPLCKLSMHHTICSDHEPIQLELCSLAHSNRQFRFRFENVWLREESFRTEVIDHWKTLTSSNMLSKMVDISAFMQKWGKSFFSKFRRKIKDQKLQLELFVDRED